MPLWIIVFFCELVLFFRVGSLAVCDIEGSTHIWKLPSNLSSHEPDELDILISLTQHNKSKDLTDEVMRS